MSQWSYTKGANRGNRRKVETDRSSPRGLKAGDMVTGRADEQRLQLFIPVATASVANLREHWAVRARRSREQRAATQLYARTSECWALRQYLGRGGKIEVRLVRVSWRQLDSDNLASALKAVRDGIAQALGVDDGPRGPITWSYGQSKAPTGEAAGVEVWFPEPWRQQHQL